MRPDFTNLRNRTKITFMATIDSYRSPFPHEELLERARRIRHVALDMDGTIYMGMSLFPWTKRFLSDLTEMGIGYSFLTNNPSKSIADYLHKLETLGIEATREEMYTTALATIDYIKTHHPADKRLFLLGTPFAVLLAPALLRLLDHRQSVFPAKLIGNRLHFVIVLSGTVVFDAVHKGYGVNDGHPTNGRRASSRFRVPFRVLPLREQRIDTRDRPPYRPPCRTAFSRQAFHHGR